MKKQYIFDIEANGLDPDKIYCLSNTKGKTLTRYDQMIKFLTSADVLIGHNIILFDIPVVEKLLGIKIKAKLVDTLALSWYLYPKRVKHGLADWGEFFGVKKPTIDDWENLPLEEYIHRCGEDVKINEKLWNKMWKHLLELYNNDEDTVWRFINYLTFKMSCVRKQEKNRWKLNVEKCKLVRDTIEKDVSSSMKELERHMPKIPITRMVSPPKKPFKIDGTLSATGLRWRELTKKKGFPNNYNKPIKVITGYKEPNAGSIPQIKQWLFDLGWKPVTFKYERDKATGKVRKIEQVNLPFGGGLCKSVKKLYAREPSLKYLDGLFLARHRYNILKGFLRDQKDGYLKASIGGLTNTLRFKHSEIVNLPKVGVKYGKEVRGVLTCGENELLCGTDLSSLEDKLKQHYIFPYDPEYVKEMNVPGFDPHLDLANRAGVLTLDQVERHKNGKENHKDVRHKFKSTNYACQYGAQGATVARTAGVPIKEGESLVEAYWERNWAIKAVSKDQKVKTVNAQKWLLNPINGFYYSLRAEKDRFSTLVQGTGVYVFDKWLAYALKQGIVLLGQFHDEWISRILKGNEEIEENIIKNSIKKLNNTLKLNVPIGCEVQFGKTYAEIH